MSTRHSGSSTRMPLNADIVCRRHHLPFAVLTLRLALAFPILVKARKLGTQTVRERMVPSVFLALAYGHGMLVSPAPRNSRDRHLPAFQVPFPLPLLASWTSPSSPATPRAVRQNKVCCGQVVAHPIRCLIRRWGGARWRKCEVARRPTVARVCVTDLHTCPPTSTSSPSLLYYF